MPRSFADFVNRPGQTAPCGIWSLIIHWSLAIYGGFKKSSTEQSRPERSADFPVRSNSGRLYGSGKFCNPPFFHAAADWKVRAPFLNPPCWPLDIGHFSFLFGLPTATLLPNERHHFGRGCGVPIVPADLGHE